MKTILLFMHDDNSDDAAPIVEAALITARLLANRFGSYIEGTFVKAPPMAGTAPIDVAPNYLVRHEAYWDESATIAQRRFTGFMEQHEIPIRDVTAPSAGPTAGWHEETGEPIRIIGNRGRLFDLIVIGRTTPSSGDKWQAPCEAALFESGRPVMVAPPAAPANLGRNILIAWNGSTETARTIGLGMPLLTGAEAVTVLSVKGASGGMVPGPDAKQVANHLVRNGVRATAKIIAAHGRSAGEAILDEATVLGVDLLVKGAYTHSRLREIIFGGTTRHVLAESRIPVLIAH